MSLANCLSRFAIAPARPFQSRFNPCRLQRAKNTCPTSPLICPGPRRICLTSWGPGESVEITVVALLPVGSIPSATGAHGMLVVNNNSATPQVDVPIWAGWPETPTCPQAVIKCLEGTEVAPQTVLHLDGTDSIPAGFSTSISKWQWSVIQPEGSTSVFVPSASFPEPSFEANVQGLYTFVLTVTDSHENTSCMPAHFDVLVLGDNAIRVELIWDTPGDTNTTDTGPDAGSDLDLHLTSPLRQPARHRWGRSAGPLV